LETQGRAGKPKDAPDADAFTQKLDFKGPRLFMGAGQGPGGFQRQRPGASFSAQGIVGCRRSLSVNPYEGPPAAMVQKRKADDPKAADQE
jgi:hypothetical protein